MSIDTERYADELRDRLRLDGLRSDLEFPAVMASSRRAARRRRAGIGGGVAAALALAVLASPVGLDAPALVADALRSARLAHVEGLAGDLSEPLHVAWRVGGDLAGVIQASGTLVVADTARLRALAPDGSQLWSLTRGSDEACRLQASVPDGDAAAGGDSVVLCLDRVTGAARLIDPQTGGSLGGVQVPALWSVQLIGDDVIGAGFDADGRPAATRWTRQGSVVWDRVVPGSSESSSGRLVTITDSTVSVASDSGVSRIDTRTGEVRDGSGPLRRARVELPGGYSAVELDAGVRAGPDDESVEAYAPDGTPVATGPGYLVTLSVDDGTVPGLLLVQDLTTVRAMDLSAGTELWHRWLVPGMVLDGRLIAWNSFNELQALDARTGEVLWHRETPRAENDHTGFGSAVTDGRTVVTRELADQPALVAVDAATGALRWSIPWDGGYQTTLTAVRGGVVAAADGTVTMLRP